VPQSDLLATATGTSNVVLFHTDLMGTLGTVSIHPGVEQTAYGLFSDLVDIAKSV
jgi:homoserine dehydrogenase